MKSICQKCFDAACERQGLDDLEVYSWLGIPRPCEVCGVDPSAYFLPNRAYYGAVSTLLEAVDWKPCANPSQELTARMAGLPWATHVGLMTLGKTEIRCIQLNDGRRLIEPDDVDMLLAALGESQ